MHDISQNNKKLLEDALTKYGIDAPEKYNFDYENVAQWGTIDRLWVKELGTGFIFGNFDKEFSDCVFLDNEPLEEVSQKARQEIFDEAIIDVESRLKFEERKTSEEASSIWENSVKADDYMISPMLFCSDDFIYAEERRIFYVALTESKKSKINWTIRITRLKMAKCPLVLLKSQCLKRKTMLNLTLWVLMKNLRTSKLLVL